MELHRSPRAIARRARHLLTVAALCAVPLTAAGAQITDATGDWLPTYTGPKNGDLDVTTAQVIFDGSNFRFTHTSAAAIGTTTGGFFVWGVDRGAGTARFPTLAPGVLFDWVLSITPGGAFTTRDLISGTSTTLDPALVTISGNRLTVIVPAALLPTRGFDLTKYTANLWPRFPGGNEGISDFAPNNSNFAVTVAPEPGSLLLVGTGLFGLLAIRRRRVD